MGLRRSPRIGRTLRQQTEEADEKMMEYGTQLLGGREVHVHVENKTDQAHAGNDDESTSTMRLSQPSGVDDEEGDAASVLENPAVDASHVDDDDDVERVDDGVGRDESTAPNDNRMETMVMALQQLTAMVTNVQEAVSLNRMRSKRSCNERVRGFHEEIESSDVSNREETMYRVKDRRGPRLEDRHPEVDAGQGTSPEDEGRDGEGVRHHLAMSDDGGDEPSDDDASEEGDEPQVPRRSRRHRSQPKRKSVKDLELPAFTPSPDMSVSTWIDRVYLALKDAGLSGRGKWSIRSLYFILRNKLLEDAATWWVDINWRTPDRKTTWKHLKRALLRRYGERRDKSTAEWRVTMRRMMPNETYADFAAGLRIYVGRNKVKQQVLLAQFYRCLEKTTRTLVKQRPRPRTLEKAVDKATDIDDPMENVAQVMINIGQASATTPSRHVVPMEGTMGPTSIIPGLSSAVALVDGSGSTTQDGVERVAMFTNPQEIYNKYSGKWDKPPGHKWNGKCWYEPQNAERKRIANYSRPEQKNSVPRQQAKQQTVVVEGSRGSESDAKTPKEEI
ncbi:unnamed protein product [Phytophthora fragariaefolia]|uniref:Unnamed protein product n=1 Tax=Phytophthora fragariaefolia TaxID=1490495 RepID=A0A9W6Y993_9STRA|nr:unnamed protein product [Phytophthora fragariaefolia]